MLAWSPDGRYLAFSCRDDQEAPAQDHDTGPELTPWRYSPLSLILRTEPWETMHRQFSPEGREIVFIGIGSDLWGNQDLWIQSLETGLRRQLTNQGYVEISQPVWPEGLNNIYYFSHMGVSMIDTPPAGCPAWFPASAAGRESSLY